MTASAVLKAQTNMNGLSGPSQLTRLKLKMRIMTPVISNTLMWRKMKLFTRPFYWSRDSARAKAGIQFRLDFGHVDWRNAPGARELAGEGRDSAGGDAEPAFEPRKTGDIRSRDPDGRRSGVGFCAPGPAGVSMLPSAARVIFTGLSGYGLSRAVEGGAVSVSFRFLRSLGLA